MDFLKAEIERKRKQLEKTNVLKEDKQYFKRGDLAAVQEQEYWSKHKRIREQGEGQSSALSVSQQAAVDKEIIKKEEAKKDKINLSRKEVIRRLRERNEPILLFGENEYEAYQRLKKLELLEPDVDKGYENDLKAALDKVDQQYINELSMGHGDKAKNAYNVHVKDSGVSEQDLEVMHEELGTGDEDRDQDIILKFAKHVLQKWGEDLNSRDDDIKQSRNGKLESAVHSQTVTYFKPLFRSLKNKTCSADILLCLVDIVKHLLERDYIKANEAYMEMAIGNAPWPIGVTMVGIHARTGREKIHDKNVAHVLNDETQRKYIQAFKRLMTRAQKYFPTDPSRMVNFEKVKPGVQ